MDSQYMKPKGSIGLPQKKILIWKPGNDQVGSHICMGVMWPKWNGLYPEKHISCWELDCLLWIFFSHLMTPIQATGIQPYVQLWINEHWEWKWAVRELQYYILWQKDHEAGWLTHWGRDKMAAIFQTTFSNAFCWMKMFEFQLRFHWNLFLRVQLTIFQHWFR